MAKRNSSFLFNVLHIFAWILVLSAFGVTIGDIVRFDWFRGVSELIINFFTW